MKEVNNSNEVNFINLIEYFLCSYLVKELVYLFMVYR